MQRDVVTLSEGHLGPVQPHYVPHRPSRPTRPWRLEPSPARSNRQWRACWTQHLRFCPC